MVMYKQVNAEDEKLIKAVLKRKKDREMFMTVLFYSMILSLVFLSIIIVLSNGF